MTSYTAADAPKREIQVPVDPPLVTCLNDGCDVLPQEKKNKVKTSKVHTNDINDGKKPGTRIAKEKKPRKKKDPNAPKGPKVSIIINIFLQSEPLTCPFKTFAQSAYMFFSAEKNPEIKKRVMPPYTTKLDRRIGSHFFSSQCFVGT